MFTAIKINANRHLGFISWSLGILLLLFIQYIRRQLSVLFLKTREWELIHYYCSGTNIRRLLNNLIFSPFVFCIFFNLLTRWNWFNAWKASRRMSLHVCYLWALFVIYLGNFEFVICYWWIAGQGRQVSWRTTRQ